MRLVFMSAYLQDYHCGLLNTNQVLKQKLQANKPHQGKPCFSKLKCGQFLYKTSNLYIMSDSYISKNVLATENIRQGGIFKEVKNLLNHTYFKDCPIQKFVCTILVTYVTILTEPDLSLQNQIRASQYDFCSMF